jgi:hypothetical protein
MRMPIVLSKDKLAARLQSESGRAGYFIAWLLGVPAWLLLMVFLIRGH